MTMQNEQQFSNRQAMADHAEIIRIAQEIEERKNKNRILDLDLRVMRLATYWLDRGKIKNPLRPLGPALEQARLALRASQLSTRVKGRTSRYYGELINQHWQSGAPRMAIREALQQRIAAGDQQAAETLHVLEVWKPEWLEGWIGHQKAEEKQP